MKCNFKSLTDYLIHLQNKGRYTFTSQEALAALEKTPDAFKLAALRLIKKKKLIRIKHGFFLIVPTEYQEVGAPPIEWFIDYLMRFNQQPYYVGLLSAAALHGAAHQQPQVFQVITNKPLRHIDTKRGRIEFFKKSDIIADYYQTIKTPTGYINVSIPEITALDLIQYVKSVGYWNQVATVLSELQENFDLNRLLKILKLGKIKIAYVQRLGYLLELINGNKKIITLLKRWIQDHKPRAIPLRPDKAYDQKQKNAEWMLYINQDIESDV